MTVPNPLRGEAEVKIAGATYRLEANMDGLTRVAQAMGDPPLHELYARLVGSGLFALRTSLAHFVQGGTDREGRRLNQREAQQAALRDFSLGEVPAVQAAVVDILAALVRKDGGGADERGNPDPASA